MYLKCILLTNFRTANLIRAFDKIGSVLQNMVNLTKLLVTKLLVMDLLLKSSGTCKTRRAI